MDRTTESLDDALGWACRIEASRRAVVVFINGGQIRWWGGRIDDWHPDETLLSSLSSLARYRKLLCEFRMGRIPKAHAVIVYRDGSFASAMLGICTAKEAGEYLENVMEIVRVRGAYSWLKA
jgi:hypothetical protein